MSEAIYLKKADYFANIEEQKKMNVSTLAILKSKGVKESSMMELDFYFYSNTVDKLHLLSDDLEKMGYELYDIEASESREGEFSLLGTVPKTEMSIESLNRWVTQMCDLGYKYDCDFSGWEAEI